MQKAENNLNITPYDEINNILNELSNRILDILGKNLIGLYLFGSLTYGDFNLDSSDIDLVAVTKHQLQQDELEKIKKLHKEMAENHKKWCERIECSYTPISMLVNILPPKEPRPYYGGGIFYDEADYGNEWIINNYLLYHHSIPLIGVSFKELTKPIDMVDVQKACVRDLFREWEPKINDPEWLDNSHYQSYIVMNLCRILYTVVCGKTASKKVSAELVKDRYWSKWHNFINSADGLVYCKKMSLKNDVIEYIKFVIEEIKKSPIYKLI